MAADMDHLYIKKIHLVYLVSFSYIVIEDWPGSRFLFVKSRIWILNWKPANLIGFWWNQSHLFRWPNRFCKPSRTDGPYTATPWLHSFLFIPWLEDGKHRGANGDEKYDKTSHNFNIMSWDFIIMLFTCLWKLHIFT
jgi:hypothetical protein